MESKSTFPNWRRDELTVEKCLSKQGFILIEKNHRLFGVEIDLVMNSPQGEVCLIEVKSAPKSGFESHRVSSSQRRRLLFVLNRLLLAGVPTRAHLVYVHKEELEMIEDFLIHQ